MAVNKTYECDLCRSGLHGSTGTPFPGVGIYWTPRNDIEIRPWREVERHLCNQCICAIQALPIRCGKGYACDGGPRCTSDHK